MGPLADFRSPFNSHGLRRAVSLALAFAALSAAGARAGDAGDDDAPAAPLPPPSIEQVLATVDALGRPVDPQNREAPPDDPQSETPPEPLPCFAWTEQLLDNAPICERRIDPPPIMSVSAGSDYTVRRRPQPRDIPQMWTMCGLEGQVLVSHMTQEQRQAEIAALVLGEQLMRPMIGEDEMVPRLLEINRACQDHLAD